MGNRAAVAPYSGAMLAMVARSARERLLSPAPQNSTKRPTTPSLRSISVTASTRSVAVDPSGSGPDQPHPDDFRFQQVERLPQQYRLGLDTAHAPAEHAERIDHRGVRIGPDQGIGKGNRLRPSRPGHDHRRQILQVDLMHDSGSRGHHPEVLEGLLGPAQQLVPLPVPLVLEIDVLGEGERGPEAIDLDRVVDDQIGRNQGVDVGDIAAEPRDGVAHGRQIDHRGDTGEILEHHPARQERQFHCRPFSGRPRLPPRQGPNQIPIHELAASVAKYVFQQDADGKWERVEIGEPLLLQRLEPVVRDRFAEGRG